MTSRGSSYALTIDPHLRAARTLPNVASHCRSVREALGLSRAQVAVRIGVSPERIYKVERGSCPPSIGLLQALVDLAGKPIGELFAFDPEVLVKAGTSTRRTAFKQKIDHGVRAGAVVPTATVPTPATPSPPSAPDLETLRQALAAFGSELAISVLEPSVAKGKYVATARFGNRKKCAFFDTSMADAIVGAIALAKADAHL